MSSTSSSTTESSSDSVTKLKAEVMTLTSTIQSLTDQLNRRDSEISYLRRELEACTRVYLPRDTTHFPPECDEQTLLPFREHITEWNFDIFRFAEVTRGRPLYHMGLELFRYLKLIETFNFDVQKIKNFLNGIEAGYHTHNPYHNNTHAADVAQTAVFFIVHGGLQDYVTPLDTLAYVLAALVHDYDHPGYNNAYMVYTGNPIAITHNDSSVLERHHCSESFKVLLQDSNNFLSVLSEPDRLYVRKQIIALVLATDFGDHFLHLKTYEEKRKTGFSKELPEDRLLLLKIALKCADISHTAKSSEMHFNWTERICREFHKQGDEEREMGRPVAPAMDRHVPVPDSQMGFIKFLVSPLYESFCDDFKQSQTCLQQLRANHAHWIAKSEMREKHNSSSQ